MKGFSIVLCTYNPDEVIFKRLLDSVNFLNNPNNNPFEIIIVDNNSSNSISQYSYIASFLKKDNNRKCVVEAKQGLTQARIRGLNEAQYDWIIYFDDDNEPNAEYLINLEKAIEENSQVHIWGPAKIKVEFIGVSKKNWVETKKEYFQERDWNATNFGINNTWQYYFPYGTGMVVNRNVLEEYVKRVNTGRYSLSDRKGKSLSSGGDLQIVLTATNMQLPVGTINGLVINHLISKEKANISYLEKQQYGTASCNISAHVQADPELKLDNTLVSNKDILRNIYYIFRNSLFRANIKDIRLKLAESFGNMNARYLFQKVERKPLLIRVYEKLINA